MPCYYTGSAEGDRALAATEKAEELATKLTQMTEFACEAMAIVEHQGFAKSCTYALRKWWQDHQKIDQQRKDQEEARRKKALAKLTAEDRHALGLDYA